MARPAEERGGPAVADEAGTPDPNAERARRRRSEAFPENRERVTMCPGLVGPLRCLAVNG